MSETTGSKERTTNSRRRGSRAGLLFACVLLVVLLGFPAVAHAVSYSAEELAFFSQINAYRQQNGLGRLLLSDAISDACEKHSSDMGKYKFFAHDTVQSDYYPAGSTPWYRMAQSGYNYSTTKGENIAAGYSTAASVFTAWKNSSGHNANMLNASFKVIGIGLVYVSGSPYGWYWTTDFGGYVDPTAHDVSTTSTTVGATTTTTRLTTTTTRLTTTTTRPPSTTTTLVRLPAAPTSLSVTSTGYTSLGLRFVDKASNERGFYLERSTNGTTYTRIATLAAKPGTNYYVYFTNSYLQRLTTYYYRVRAYNSYGVSAYSNVVSARTR